MKHLSRPLLPTLVVSAPALLFAFAPVRSAEALSLEPIGRYASGIFDDSAAEIVAYDPASERLFVTNSADERLDVLDIADPASPALIAVIDVSPYGKSPTSCAVYGGVVAVAVVAPVTQDPGKVVFFNAADGSFISEVTAGALPDNLTFTPDGSKVLVANEGEPSGDYTVDPEGSVSIIDLSGGVAALDQGAVSTVTFESLNGSEESFRRAGIRIFGPGASAAQDLEPEFITVDPNGEKAYVTLQENNAIAIIDIASASLDSVVPLGYKFHFTGSNGIDSSDDDGGAIDIRRLPVYGMYQPDAIASFQVKGKTYLVTANEGDARDYDAFSEERRIKDFNGEADDDDGVVRSVNNSLLRRYPGLLEDEELGRLRTTTAAPFGVRTLRDGSLGLRALFSYGARSFSILNDRGGLVYESGDEFEQLTAALVPEIFNSNNDETEADGRSDDKGPEPEGVTVGEIGGRIYAFITLERIGGVMVYDVTKPRRATFVDYVTTRLDAEDANAATPGDDLGPEGILFIPAGESPNGKPLLVVAHEVSGSTVVFEIKE